METCIHFTGIQNRACDAGVAYDDVKKLHEPIPYESRGHQYTSRSSLPCIASHNYCGVECTKREVLDEQAAREKAEANDRAIQEEIGYIGTARKTIVERTGNKGGGGVIACPKCGGNLGYSQAASNKHVHARCEKPGCLAWME